MVRPARTDANAWVSSSSCCSLPTKGVRAGWWPEQVAAERIEVFGNAGREFGSIGSVEVLLSGNQLAGRAGEGTPSRERFKQHYAHGVPVGWFRCRQSGGLLGRHISWSAGARIYLSRPLGAHFGDQSEIEDHDPTFACHQHIGRLDIAVQGARAVKFAEAFRQLAGGCTEARRVRRAWYERDGAGCGALPGGEYDFGHW